MCPTATAPDLAEGLRFFLTDSSRLSAAGAASAASAADYSEERFVDAWALMFDCSSKESVCA